MAENQIVWTTSMACQGNKFTFKYPSYDGQNPDFWPEISVNPPVYSYIETLINKQAAKRLIEMKLAVPFDNFWEYGIVKVRHPSN
jgi:hypothetical protein